MLVDVLMHLFGFWILAQLSFVGYAWHSAEPILFPHRYDIVLARAEYCVRSQKFKEQDFAKCAVPEVQRLLSEKSGADVMDDIAQDLKPLACHYLGHIVGQESYLKNKDVEGAISQCNRNCDSACVHGVIGGAFADALGVDGFGTFDLDLKHLSADEIRTVGKRLCITIGTCHGVGHALFQIYQNFDQAFAVCRQVAGNMLNMCDNGVTMEYADTLSGRNMGALPNIEFPDPEALDSLCVFPGLIESRACFRYFPRMVIVTLGRQGVSEEKALERVRAICSSYADEDMRIVCFNGYGSTGSYLPLTNLQGALRWCQALGGGQATVSCIIGILGVATEDRRSNLAAYCDAMNEQYRGICYHGLFYFLDRVGFSEVSQQALCKENDGVCLQGFEQRKTDPTIQVRAMK